MSVKINIIIILLTIETILFSFVYTQNDSPGISWHIIDAFDDGDTDAENRWGFWIGGQGGPNNDHSGNLDTDKRGRCSKAARYVYQADSGDWQYNHISLEFGRSVDLAGAEISKFSFWLKGKGDAEIKFFPWSEKAGVANGYGAYKVNLGKASKKWTKYIVRLSDLKWDGGNKNYSLEEAFQSCLALKWEVNQENAVGEIWIDDFKVFNNGSSVGDATETIPEIPDYPGSPVVNWQLIWSDEFDYTGPPDPAKWAMEDKRPGWVNNELQNYTGDRLENARVENGMLIIEGRMDKYGGHKYSSGRVHSQDKGQFLYGRCEFRAKLPKGRGLWPALWLMPNDFYGYGEGWPDSGEIDVMEWVGKDPRWVHASIHNKNYYWVNGNQKTDKIFGTNFTDEFHVYAMEWYPDRIDIYLDDKRYFSTSDPGEGWQGWPYDKPFYVIMNLAIGGNWGGPVDDSIFPQQLLVDYVRIYREE